MSRKKLDKIYRVCLVSNMACITPARRTQLLTKISRLESQLETLYTAYETMISSGVSSYKFDSGEGSQSTNYRSLKEVSNEIERIESQIEKAYKQLNGGGIVNMNLRRKNYQSDGRII